MFLWRSVVGVVSLLNGTSDSTVSNLPKADIGVEKKRQVINQTACPKTTALFHPTLQTRVDAGEHVHTHTCPYPGCETRCSRQDDFLYHLRTHVSPSRPTGSTGRAQHRAAANHTVTASNDGHSVNIRLKSASAAEEWTGTTSALTDTQGAGRSALPRNAVAAGLNVPSASAGCTLALNAVIVPPTPYLPTPQTDFLFCEHDHQHQPYHQFHHADPAFIEIEDNFTSASILPFNPHPHLYDDFQATAQAQEPYFGTVTSGALRFKHPSRLRDDLVRISESPQLRTRALDLRHAEAARFNDSIHRCLSTLREGDPGRVPILRLLQDVCSESGELPSGYWLQKVTVDWRKPIARGGEASIFGARLRDRNVVARQVLASDGRGWGSEVGRKALQYIHREIITHAQLRHPNIIAFLGVFQDDDAAAPLIIVPFLERGSAMHYLSQLSGTDLRINTGSILSDVVSALEYLHSRNPPVYHGDVHSDNVLIDAKGNAVLCDFGFSRIRHEITRTRTLIREGGRLRYLAPELFSGHDKFRTSSDSDIYSLGMTFLALVTLGLPFADVDRELEAAHQAERGIRPMRPPEMNLMLSDEDPMWNLLECMWQHEPEQRPIASDVMARLKQILSPV